MKLAESQIKNHFKLIFKFILKTKEKTIKNLPKFLTNISKEV